MSRAEEPELEPGAMEPLNFGGAKLIIFFGAGARAKLIIFWGAGSAAGAMLIIVCRAGATRKINDSGS